MRHAALCLVVIPFLISCQERETPEPHAVDSRSDLPWVAEEVEAAVWAFHAADTTADAEAVIDLLWPEFYILLDGQHFGYDVMASRAREFMPTVETFATEWTDLRITPLGPNHAVSSFLFADSIVTRSGSRIRSRGPTTFVWEKRDGEWRVLYADADHYPIDQQG